MIETHCHFSVSFSFPFEFFFSFSSFLSPRMLVCACVVKLIIKPAVVLCSVYFWWHQSLKVLHPLLRLIWFWIQDC